MRSDKEESYNACSCPGLTLPHQVSYPWFQPLKNKECNWKVRAFPTPNVSHSTSSETDKKGHKLCQWAGNQDKPAQSHYFAKHQLTFLKQQST